MSCPTEGQHTTSQHIKKDGVPNDAVDWQEPDDLTIVITRCECGAFKKSGEPCKRCENLSSFFENSAGVDSITAQQLTDIAAKHESADDALVHIQKGLNGTGTENVLAATKLALEQYYQTEITPPPQEQSANGHALTSNGHTSDNSAQTAYQEARGRFTSLMGDDALDTDDNLAPGYEGLQGTPLYEQFATTRDEYRAHMGMDNDPDVVEGEMRDGRYTLPKRVRTSLQASGLSGRDTTQLSRRFVEIGKESASRQQRRINARIESILTAEGITDPDAIARVTDVMNGRRRAKAASSSAVSKKKKSSRPKREVSEATRQKLREAAARRVRCPKCAAFMGKTECKRCTALREALEEIGIPASRLAVVQDQISGAAKKVEREYRQRNHTLMRQEAQEYLAEINRGDLAMPVLEALDKQLGEEPEKPLLAHLTPVDEWVRMGARPFEDKTLFPDWEKYGFSWDVDWETDDPEQATRWQHELETALAVALGHEITSGRKRKPIELDENEISVAQEIITALNAGETSPITVGRSPGGELNERANTLQELLSQAAADIRAGLAPTSVDKAAIAFNHRILRQTNPPQHVIEQATELRAEVGAKEIAETVDVTEAPEPGSGSAPTQHCPRCGRFVSPEQDCQHCGMTTADIADPARHEMGWYLAPDDLPVYTTQADAEAGGYRSSNEQEALALIEGSQLDIYQHPLRAIAAAEGLSYQVNYPALHANFASDDRRAMLDAADMVQAFHATQDTADPKLAEQPSQAWAFTHAFAGSRENLLAVIEDENAESPTALADKDALPHILLGYDKIQGTAVNCGDCGKLRSPDQPCLNCTGPGDANEEVLEASFLAAGWDESGSSSHAFHFGSRSAVAKRLADEPTSLMAPHLEKVLLEYDTRTGQAVKCENCGKFKSFDQACLHCDGMKAEALPESDEPAIETESAPEPGAAPSTEPEPTAHPVVTFTEGLGLSDDIVTLLTEAYDAGQIITFDELNDVLLATRVNGRPTDADFTQSWHDAVQKYGGTRQGIVDYINHPDTTDEEAATARQVLVGVDAGRNSAVKCADCGKFKSPDQPCVHCGGTETAELLPTPRTTTEIAHERGWTWIKFPALREMSRTERAEYRSIFDALREQHKVKWSKKRQAWFARSKVDPDEINRIVAEHEPAEKVPFTEETAPSPTPVDLPAPQPIAPGSVGRADDWMQDADGGLHRIAYIHHNGEGTQVGVEAGPSSGRITMSPDDVQAQFGVTIEPPTAVSKNGEMVRVG
ncbi:MAG: hypothetical protein GY796_23010, partial [Chloroflexi bacterium]|nr:hypothetical protein [Chloroflexota bacterium]